MTDGKHEAGLEPASITIDGVPLGPAPTWFNYVKHYGKAFIGGIIAGLLYFLTVLAPAATVGDITMLQWIGFTVTVLGTWTGVAVTTNGAKPVKN